MHGKRVQKHTHASTRSRVEETQVANKAKDMATTQSCTIQVLHFANTGIAQATEVRLKDANLRQLVQQAKVQVAAAPANPATLFELYIPDDWRMYGDNGNEQLFLVYDSSEDLIPLPADERILIVAIPQNLDLLEVSDEWYVDGTFTAAPPLFD